MARARSKKAAAPGKTAAKKRAKPAPRKPTSSGSAPKKSAPKKSAPKKSAPKKSSPKKTSPKKTSPKKTSPKKTAARPAAKRAASKKQTSTGPTTFRIDDHPQYTWLVEHLPPGKYAEGMFLATAPGALDAEMGPWLMGNVEGRRSIGRTAFGDIVIFRDLRARAKGERLPKWQEACDIAIIDIHEKRMNVVAYSSDYFVQALTDREFQENALRGQLYEDAKRRIGPYADDECFAFVPALALGGTEDAETVRRQRWDVHQALLLQT